MFRKFSFFNWRRKCKTVFEESSRNKYTQSKDEDESGVGFDSLPVEVQELIFGFLDGEDLWNCLRVCSKWRSVANDDILWRRHCFEGFEQEEAGCEVVDKTTSMQDLSGLCELAIFWNCWKLGPMTKWKERRFKSLKRIAFPVQSCFASYQRTLLVYNRGKPVFMLYHGSSMKMLPVPDAFYEVRSIIINEQFIVGSCRDGFIVYRRHADDSYHLHLIFGTVVHDAASFIDLRDLAADYFWPLELVGFFKTDILIAVALYSDYFYIFQLSSGKYEKKAVLFTIEDTLKCEKYFALHGGNSAHVYTPDGMLIFSTDYPERNETIDICINNYYLVVFWAFSWDVISLPSGEKTTYAKTQILNCCILPYKGDIIYILSQESEIYDKLSAVSLSNGKTSWVKLYRNSHDMNLICNRYILLSTKKKYWYLLEAKAGTTLYCGTGSFEHISDFFTVASDSDNYFDISYYGSVHRHKPRNCRRQKSLCAIN